MTPSTKTVLYTALRTWPRYSNLKDLSLSYEGRSEVFPVHPPDISPTGMFINTAADFPEGAILKLSFRLAKSNHPIYARCEVRYCLEGVGVGVEFIGLSSGDQRAIAKEIRVPSPAFTLTRPRAAKKAARRKKKR